MRQNSIVEKPHYILLFFFYNGVSISLPSPFAIVSLSNIVEGSLQDDSGSRSRDETDTL